MKRTIKINHHRGARPVGSDSGEGPEASRRQAPVFDDRNAEGRPILNGSYKMLFCFFMSMAVMISLNGCGNASPAPSGDKLKRLEARLDRLENRMRSFDQEAAMLRQYNVATTEYYYIKCDPYFVRDKHGCRWPIKRDVYQMIKLPKIN